MTCSKQALLTDVEHQVAKRLPKFRRQLWHTVVHKCMRACVHAAPEPHLQPPRKPTPKNYNSTLPHKYVHKLIPPGGLLPAAAVYCCCCCLSFCCLPCLPNTRHLAAAAGTNQDLLAPTYTPAGLTVRGTSSDALSSDALKSNSGRLRNVR